MDELSCICLRSNDICSCNRPEIIEQTERRKCLCGRSLTEYCMSWHSLCSKVFMQKREEAMANG